MILMEKKKIGMLSIIMIAFFSAVIGGTFTYFAISFTDERTENNQGETIVKQKNFLML